LKSHPKVLALSPRYGAGVTVVGTPTVSTPKKERPNQVGVRLSGINPLLEEKLTGFSRFVIDGNPLEDGEDGFILIGANLIAKYSSFADANIPGLDLLRNVEVGDRVKVILSKDAGESVVKDMYVKGIVKSKVDEISTRMFVTDQELKRLLPVNKDQVQEIAIQVAPGQTAALISELKDFMEGYSARIQTSDEAIPSFLRNIETTMSILGNALSSFALVVASITVFIVIYINAVTKRKFIGIMKGIGISPLAIQAAYLFQALFYGLTGSLIGLALTFGILKPYFDENPINFPFSDGILAVTPQGAMMRVAILLVVTIIAGYIPAKLIVRRNTLDSILGR
jgi:putative ABC transport system permease protein